MGTEGMKYSLVSREVIADSIETVVGCAGMDGYVAAGMMSIHPFAIDEPDEEIIIAKGGRGGRETRCRGARPRADQTWPPTPPCLARAGPNNRQSRAWTARPP